MSAIPSVATTAKRGCKFSYDLKPSLVSATELACRVVHCLISNDAMMSAKPALF
jgi:hypothetical protein